MAKVDGLLSYEVYIICVRVSHQSQPQLSHQLLFHIPPPPQKKHRKYIDINMVTVPSGWTSHLIVNVFPAPRFAGTLLVMKRRTAGCCVPGSPGKMAMSYEPRLHGESWIITETIEVQNLEHP